MTACSVQPTSTGYKVAYREEGKQRSKSFDTRSDANRWAAIVRVAGIEEGLRVLRDESRDDVVTVAEAFTAHMANKVLKPGTRDEYLKIARRYFADLDPLPVHVVTKARVVAWVNDLHQTRGLSAKTVTNAHGLLSGVMSTAVEEGWITANPCRSTRMPSSERREKVWLTEAQGVALIRELPEWYRPLVILIAATGMRFGEVTALQWRDIDTASGVAWVRRGWHKVGGKYELSTPKTKRSARRVMLPALALDVLEHVRERSKDTSSQAIIFRGPNKGVRIHPAHFREKVWHPARERAGITERATPHSLRDSQVAWQIARGTSLSVIQDRLGHESITTTINVYGHLDPALLQASVEAAGAALSGLGGAQEALRALEA